VGLGAYPLAGSRGRQSPWSEAKPLEAEGFVALKRTKERQISPFWVFCKLVKCAFGNKNLFLLKVYNFMYKWLYIVHSNICFVYR